MRRRLHHAFGVAGGADTSTFAAEGDQEVVAAAVTAGAGETVRQYAAAQKAAQVAVDVLELRK